MSFSSGSAFDVFWDQIPPLSGNITLVCHDAPDYLILQHPFLSTVVSLIVIYFLWYEFKVVHRPLMYGGKEGLREYLLERCPVLSQTYRPTFWAWHYHLSTTIRYLMQCSTPVEYERQVVVLPDGGVIALDWAECQSQSEDNIAKPVLLILPGITSDSNQCYILHYVNDGLLNGCHSVVFNQRGMGDTPVTTPKICAVCDADMNAILDIIQERFPKSPIIGLGTSLGSMILTKYLHSNGEHSRISAAINVSTVFDIEKSRPNLEGRWLNRKIYVNSMLGGLKKVVRRDSKVIIQNQQVNIERILKVSSVTDFNKELIVPTYGFNSLYHYHQQASVHDKLSNVRVPYLSIMAMDDPFAPSNTIPVDEFERNPNTVLLLTRHGGHIGFIEGWPRGPSWADKVIRQFLSAIKPYLSL